MIDPVIRQRYGYGAARLCVCARPYRRSEQLPPLRDAISIACDRLGPGPLARAGVAVFLSALLAQGLWNALDDRDDLQELHVVPFEESVPEEVPQLAALEEPEPPPPPAPEAPPQVAPVPEPVRVAMDEPPARVPPPPVREQPAPPRRTKPVVELAAIPNEVRAPEPAPERARIERTQRQPRERRQNLAMAPVAPETPPEPLHAARGERRSAPAQMSARPRPSVAFAEVPNTPSAPRDTPAPPPRRPVPVRSTRGSRRPRPSLQTPSSPGATATGGASSRPRRVPRRGPERTSPATTRVSAPRVPTAGPVPASPRTLAGSARLDERPPEQPRQPARRSEPEKRLEGVTLGSLASCISDREEDALKQRLLVAVGSTKECVSAAGRYRFVETRNLNAFLMWIERAPHRSEADRCVELSLALECLKRSSPIAGETR